MHDRPKKTFQRWQLDRKRIESSHVFESPGWNGDFLLTIQRFLSRGSQGKYFGILRQRYTITNRILSLRAGSPLSHAREHWRAKRSDGKESGEERFGARGYAHAFVLQREPARRLGWGLKPKNLRKPLGHYIIVGWRSVVPGGSEFARCLYASHKQSPVLKSERLP